MNRSASSVRDRGLTLVELIVTVTLLGIVMAALAGSVAVFLRNQDDPSNRIDRTRGLQQLVNYFPADVASAQLTQFDPPWTRPCLTLGSPILNLVWSESFPGTETETVSVTYVKSSDGTQLFRNVCTTGGPETITVARDITDAEAVAGADVAGQVDLVLDFPEASEIITGSSRNR